MTLYRKIVLHVSLTFLHVFPAEVLTDFILEHFFQSFLYSEEPWITQMVQVS